MTPGREWDDVALAVVIVGVVSGLAIAMALSLSGCAAAGHGDSDAVGPVADRASWSACDMYLDAPDAGAPSSVTECADQSAIASGYVACCIADGTSAVRPIPGGPFDPCVLPQAPGTSRPRTASRRPWYGGSRSTIRGGPRSTSAGKAGLTTTTARATPAAATDHAHTTKGPSQMFAYTKNPHVDPTNEDDARAPEDECDDSEEDGR